MPWDGLLHGVLLGSRCRSRTWSFPHGDGLMGRETERVWADVVIARGLVDDAGPQRFVMQWVVWPEGGVVEVVPPGVRENCPKPFRSSSR